MPDGRVLIGDGHPLAESPSWTRYDNLGSSCRCAGWEIVTGRSSEFDTTDTGTATVYFNDRNRTLDTTDLVGRPIQLQVRDPVTSAWEEQYRGVIDDIATEANPNAFVSNAQLLCKDMFDYLAQTEMELVVFGETSPIGSEGSVYYEAQPVDERIEDMLEDADVPAAMGVVFSGNVDVQAVFYDVGEPILSGLRDACDAEFPGIANCYVDRFGRFVFHGRFARFDPEGTAAGAGGGAWVFTRWDAATREDVTSGVAQIRRFSWNMPRTRIINSYTAWPRGLTDDLLPAQNITDGTSRTAYGPRARTAGDLIIKEHKTNGNTGAEECQLFAEFYVANYADPRKNIQTVTFKSVRPTDARAAATWALMTQADISDVINLTVDEAGLADEAYYIEGFRKTLRVLSPEFDYFEVTPNLTPEAYYTDNVFEP